MDDNLPISINSSSTTSPYFRAVVVDSLLCFVHNFRQLPHLRSILTRHFPVPSFVRSFQLLVQLSPDPDDLVSPLCSSHPEGVDSLLNSLLLRFDRLSSTGQAPIFAASDLLSLPLRLNFKTLADGEEFAGNEEGVKMDKIAVGDELRHIRFMLQQIFWLQQQLPADRKNSSSPPFPDFAHQHCPMPSLSSSSSSSVSIFAQLGQSIFSSPECPLTRPLPATTPKEGQTTATIGIPSSSPIMQSNRRHTVNGKRMSPSKSRGRLDDVVEKLTREKRFNRNEAMDGGEDEPGTGTDEKEVESSVTMEEVTASEDEDNAEEVQHQQQQPLQMSPATTNAVAMASSYAMQMQMLRHLAIGAGGFGEMLEEAQKQRQMGEEGETRRLAKRKELEEEEAEERNDPMFEEVGEDNNGICGNTMSTNEEGEDKQMDTAHLVGTAGAASPTLSEGSFVGRNSANNREEEEKPLWCNWPNCQKRFRNKFLLKKHRFIHSGEKPHKCPFCDKQFNRKDNLLRHKKTHLQNGMSELSGLKRRHNMLYGVSAEEALLNGMILPMGGTSTDKHRRGTKKKATSKGKEHGNEVES
uniref:C2H2-type domain-containing protein n=1 Tax=Globodera rostochiensis TaxID=31243 RepID=A0A914H1A0_GLORO